MNVLGIDPGLNGAVALYAPDREPLVWDMPLHHKGSLDAVALASIIRSTRAEAAVVEKVGSMPRQAGAFSFGFYTGIAHGALAAANIPIHTIAPVVWKRAMGIHRVNETDDLKTKSRSLAMKLFPDQASLFERVKDDGRAEALLLAYYFHFTLKGVSK